VHFVSLHCVFDSVSVDEDACEMNFHLRFESRQQQLDGQKAAKEGNIYIYSYVHRIGRTGVRETQVRPFPLSTKTMLVSFMSFWREMTKSSLSLSLSHGTSCIHFLCIWCRHKLTGSIFLFSAIGLSTTTFHELQQEENGS
jgi:hypothetical protein